MNCSTEGSEAGPTLSGKPGRKLGQVFYGCTRGLQLEWEHPRLSQKFLHISKGLSLWIRLQILQDPDACQPPRRNRCELGTTVLLIGGFWTKGMQNDAFQPLGDDPRRATSLPCMSLSRRTSLIEHAVGMYAGTL